MASGYEDSLRRYYGGTATDFNNMTLTDSVQVILDEAPELGMKGLANVFKTGSVPDALKYSGQTAAIMRIDNELRRLQKMSTQEQKVAYANLPDAEKQILKDLGYSVPGSSSSWWSKSWDKISTVVGAPLKAIGWAWNSDVNKSGRMAANVAGAAVGGTLAGFNWLWNTTTRPWRIAGDLASEGSRINSLFEDARRQMEESGVELSEEEWQDLYYAYTQQNGYDVTVGFGSPNGRNPVDNFATATLNPAQFVAGGITSLFGLDTPAPDWAAPDLTPDNPYKRKGGNGTVGSDLLDTFTRSVQNIQTTNEEYYEGGFLGAWNRSANGEKWIDPYIRTNEFRKMKEAGFEGVAFDIATFMANGGTVEEWIQDREQIAPDSNRFITRRAELSAYLKNDVFKNAVKELGASYNKISPGRLQATAYGIPKDTFAFGVVSGGVDLVANFALDPTLVVGKGVKALRVASKAVNAMDAQKIGIGIKTLRQLDEADEVIDAANIIDQIEKISGKVIQESALSNREDVTINAIFNQENLKGLTDDFIDELEPEDAANLIAVLGLSPNTPLSKAKPLVQNYLSSLVGDADQLFFNADAVADVDNLTQTLRARSILDIMRGQAVRLQDDAIRGEQARKVIDAVDNFKPYLDLVPDTVFDWKRSGTRDRIIMTRIQNVKRYVDRIHTAFVDLAAEKDVVDAPVTYIMNNLINDLPGGKQIVPFLVHRHNQLLAAGDEGFANYDALVDFVTGQIDLWAQGVGTLPYLRPSGANKLGAKFRIFGSGLNDSEITQMFTLPELSQRGQALRRIVNNFEDLSDKIDDIKFQGTFQRFVSKPLRVINNFVWDISHHTPVGQVVPIGMEDDLDQIYKLVNMGRFAGLTAEDRKIYKELFARGDIPLDRAFAAYDGNQQTARFIKGQIDTAIALLDNFASQFNDEIFEEKTRRFTQMLSDYRRDIDVALDEINTFNVSATMGKLKQDGVLDEFMELLDFVIYGTLKRSDNMLQASRGTSFEDAAQKLFDDVRDMVTDPQLTNLTEEITQTTAKQFSDKIGITNIERGNAYTSQAARYFLLEKFLGELFDSMGVQREIGNATSRSPLSKWVDRVMNSRVYAVNNLDVVQTPAGPQRMPVFPVSQYSSQSVIPRFMDMYRHWDNLNWLQKSYRVLFSNDVIDTVIGKYWKIPTLMRLGFVPRAAGEEFLAFFGREGLSSVRAWVASTITEDRRGIFLSSMGKFASLPAKKLGELGRANMLDDVWRFSQQLAYDSIYSAREAAADELARLVPGAQLNNWDWIAVTAAHATAQISKQFKKLQWNMISEPLRQALIAQAFLKNEQDVLKGIGVASYEDTVRSLWPSAQAMWMNPYMMQERASAIADLGGQGIVSSQMDQMATSGIEVRKYHDEIDSSVIIQIADAREMHEFVPQQVVTNKVTVTDQKGKLREVDITTKDGSRAVPLDVHQQVAFALSVAVNDPIARQGILETFAGNLMPDDMNILSTLIDPQHKAKYGTLSGNRYSMVNNQYVPISFADYLDRLQYAQKYISDPLDPVPVPTTGPDFIQRIVEATPVAERKPFDMIVSKPKLEQEKTFVQNWFNARTSDTDLLAPESADELINSYLDNFGDEFSFTSFNPNEFTDRMVKNLQDVSSADGRVFTSSEIENLRTNLSRALFGDAETTGYLQQQSTARITNSINSLTKQIVDGNLISLYNQVGNFFTTTASETIIGSKGIAVLPRTTSLGPFFDELIVAYNNGWFNWNNGVNAADNLVTTFNEILKGDIFEQYFVADISSKVDTWLRSLAQGTPITSRQDLENSLVSLIKEFDSFKKISESILIEDATINPEEIISNPQVMSWLSGSTDEQIAEFFNTYSLVVRRNNNEILGTTFDSIPPVTGTIEIDVIRKQPLPADQATAGVEQKVETPEVKAFVDNLTNLVDSVTSTYGQRLNQIFTQTDNGLANLIIENSYVTQANTFQINQTTGRLEFSQFKENTLRSQLYEKINNTDPSARAKVLPSSTPFEEISGKAIPVEDMRDVIARVSADEADFDFFITPNTNYLIDDNLKLTIVSSEQPNAQNANINALRLYENFDELSEGLTNLDLQNFAVIAIRKGSVPSYYATISNAADNTARPIKVLNPQNNKVVLRNGRDPKFLELRYRYATQRSQESIRQEVIDELDTSGRQGARSPLLDNVQQMLANNEIGDEEFNIETFADFIGDVRGRGQTRMVRWGDLEEELPFGTARNTDEVARALAAWKKQTWSKIKRRDKSKIHQMIQNSASGEGIYAEIPDKFVLTSEQMNRMTPAMLRLYDVLDPVTNPYHELLARALNDANPQPELYEILRIYAEMNNNRLAQALFDDRPIRFDSEDVLREKAIAKTYALLNDPNLSYWVDSQRASITGFASGREVQNPPLPNERDIFTVEVDPVIADRMEQIKSGTNGSNIDDVISQVLPTADDRSRYIINTFLREFDTEIMSDSKTAIRKPISYIVFNNRNDANLVANLLKSIPNDLDENIVNLENAVQIIRKRIPRSDNVIDYNVLEDIDTQLARITRDDGFNGWSGDAAMESFDPKMEQAERMYEATKALFYSPRGEILQEWVMPSVRGEFDVAAVSTVPVANMPTRMYAPVQYVYDPSWIDVVSNKGFTHINKAIYSLVRKPMYTLAFAESYESAKAVGNALRDDGLAAWVRSNLAKYEKEPVFISATEGLAGKFDDTGERITEKITRLDEDTFRRIWYMIPGDIQDSIWDYDGWNNALVNLARRNMINEAHPIWKWNREVLAKGDNAETFLTWLRNDQHVQEQIVKIAHQNAMQKVIPYIDDSRVRSFFQDKVSNIFPFLFAQESFLKRWIRSTIYDPNTIRRTQLVAQSVTNNVFTEEDEYGNKYFVIPMTESLNEVLSDPKMSVILGQLTVPGGAGLGINMENFLPGVPRDFSNLPAMSPYAMLYVNEVVKRNPEFIPFFETFTGDFPIVPENQNLTNPTYYLSAFIPRNYQRLIMGLTTLGTESMQNELAATNIAAIRQATYMGLNLKLEQDALIKMGRTEDALAMQDQIDTLLLPSNATPKQMSEYLANINAWARANMVLRAAIGWTVGTTPVNLFDEDKLEPEFTKLLKYMPLDEAVAIFLNENRGANPYTVFLSGKSSKAELPRSEQAMEWLDVNRQWIENYPKSAVWLIPQSDNEDQYSARADANYRAYKMRFTKSAKQWFEDYTYASTANEYFPLKTQYEVQISQARSASERNRLRKEWQMIADDIKTRNPIFAQVLQNRGEIGESELVLNELSQILALPDSELPEIEHLDSLRAFVDTWRSYQLGMQMLQGENDRKARNARKALRQNFLEWGDQAIVTDPKMRLFWYSVMLPATSLSSDYDLMKELG